MKTIAWTGAVAIALVPVLTILIRPLREGAKDLMDHWKEEKVIIREVKVPVPKALPEEADAEAVETELNADREAPVVEVEEAPDDEDAVVEVEVIREVPVEVVKEKVVYRDIDVDGPEPLPPPLPLSVVPRKQVDVKDLFNEIQIRTDVAVRKGGLPSVERDRDDSYRAHFQVVVNVPQASDSMGELAEVNARLPKLLPGLNRLIPRGKVSGFFHLLYRDKLEHTKKQLTNLDRALSRHNFYDCQTILELVDPDTRQKVLLVQADMDVVADGSDGDRLSTMDPAVISSPTYQAETSYRWPKRTAAPNPLIPYVRQRLETARRQLAGGASAAERPRLEYQVKRLTQSLEGMAKQSFLIAAEDPFIVLPLSMRPYIGHHARTPAMGDYAAVIHGNRVYPAVCGDYEPKTKIGEGSLRLAKAINPKATPRYRPVSDVSVTYLIFPGSRDLPLGPPDYGLWEARCQELLNHIGGLGAGAAWHQWKDRLGARRAEEETGTGIVP